MVLKIVTGYSPDYLLKEVATGRESYYTGAVTEGEPPGRWWGVGAEKLGLTGLVDAQDMRGVYERFLDPRADGFRDPKRWEEVSTLGHTGRKYPSEEELYAASIEREPHASAERRVQLRTEASNAARHNVAFFDVTFNVQKSVTLVHTAFEAKEVAARRAGDDTAAEGWAQFREEVEAAIWAGNQAGLAYLAEHAGYSRIGHHGGAAGRWVDAHEWVVASFFQHDSREHDPHLHIHNALLNRVEGPDGTWRTVDSKALYKFRPAAAAVAERTTEERLAAALGVLIATRPDGKAREIVGIAQEAMDLISTRRHKLTAKADELVTEFKARYGRAPNGLERDRIAQQATLLTRAAKSHTGETREQLLDRINQRVRAEVTGGLAGVADAVLAARGDGPAPMTWSPRAVVEVALADLEGRKAAWTEGDLAAAINRALPDHLGVTEGADVARLLDTLTQYALDSATSLDAARPGDAQLPAELRLANGDSSFQAPGARLYATPAQVRTERALVTAAMAGGATALPRETVERFLTGLADVGVMLGPDQAAAIRGVLTSGARVESLVGPAGTGKSFVVGTMAQAWTDPAHQPVGGPGRRVFGLATAQIATDVLAAEGVDARNVAAWLATQARLAGGTGVGPRPVDGDEAWRLRVGDLVVVDESAMADTPALAAIHRHVEKAGAKLLLVGDHRQLAAIGAGGGMELLANSGARYELADARRFTHDWERAASLRLRAGDETVLDVYHRHGRLRDSGTVLEAEQAASTAWLADTLAGRRALLLVDTNEQAARVCAAIRAELVRLGLVTEQGVALGLQGTVAGVGDLVEARKLDRTILGYEGNRRHVVNREHYRVHAVRDDGGLEVSVVLGRTPDGDVLGERLILPPTYVAEHLALGYASTVHAVQGGAVDATHNVVTPNTSLEAFYVQSSRGREDNTAYVATTTTVDDPAQGSEARHTLHRTPVAVLTRILESADQRAAASALATATDSVRAAQSVQTAAELLAAAAQQVATARTAGWLDQLTTDGVLAPAERARLAAEDGAASLARVLRRVELAGRDPEHALHTAIAEQPLDGARNLTNVVYARINQARRYDPVGDSWADWTPQVEDPEWADYLKALAGAADQRAARLAEQAVAEPPRWALDAFGPVPDTPAERAGWRDKARVVAGYREQSGHDDPDTALGRAPKAGQVEAYAAYRAAWRALGRPEVDRDLHELSPGQLRACVRGWERQQTWGPHYVGNELAGTRQAATTHRQTATLKAAEGDAATDPGDRERLLRESSQAAALAATLDAQILRLEDLDTARTRWLVHTAGDRGKADAAAYLLAEQQAGDPPEPEITGDDWLATHHAAMRAEDPYRPITEHDLTDQHDHAEHDRAEHDRAEHDRAEHDRVEGTDDDAAIRDNPPGADSGIDDSAIGDPPRATERQPERTRDEPPPAEPDDIPPATAPATAPEPVELETAVPDIRETAAHEHRPDEDTVRVTTPEQLDDHDAQARRALAEIEAQQAYEAAMERDTYQARDADPAREDPYTDTDTRDDTADDTDSDAGQNDADVDADVDDVVVDRPDYQPAG